MSGFYGFVRDSEFPGWKGRLITDTNTVALENGAAYFQLDGNTAMQSQEGLFYPLVVIRGYPGERLTADLDSLWRSRRNAYARVDSEYNEMRDRLLVSHGQPLLNVERLSSKE